jgi:tRNA-2-methylthio-N6-dimethylallyladenosine synthase
VRQKTYFIYTFGCQANKLDSERLAGEYQARGYVPTRSADQADEIVINTCSVRQRAEDRAIGLINNLAKKLSQRKPKIILTGCMTHYGKHQLLKRWPLLDEVIPIIEIGFNQPIIRQHKHHAWVSISSGCNSFCSYCIVPFSRGRERSRPEKEILTEIRQLLAQGYCEITLLGQNVNSYGLEKISIRLRKQKKLKNKPPFVKLLEKICQFKQLKKISFLTANPWDFSDALIKVIAANPQIDRYLHLPVQSGSDRILKLMNRGYTAHDYLKLVKKIRQKIPDVVLGTDIIVGFPSETEKDFQATVALAKKVNWQLAFVSQYSPRPHTLAAKLYPDDVPPAEKKRRWQILEDLINQKHLSHRPKIAK